MKEQKKHSQSDPLYDENLLLSKQKRLQLFLNQSLKDDREFSGVKHNRDIYRPGDFVQLYDVTTKNPYVVRLKRIVQIPSNLEKLPFIQVEWCVKKENLPQKILKNYGKHISIAQIFQSNTLTCLYIESIKGKCDVISEQKYSQMNVSYSNTYFTRARFNEKDGSLDPSPLEWKRICSCNSPVNPDLEYVLCGKCEEWFHAECVKNFSSEETFYCEKCNHISDSSED